LRRFKYRVLRNNISGKERRRSYRKMEKKQYQEFIIVDRQRMTLGWSTLGRDETQCAMLGMVRKACKTLDGKS
jgi:hypothetical protein